MVNVVQKSELCSCAMGVTGQRDGARPLPVLKAAVTSKFNRVSFLPFIQF